MTESTFRSSPELTHAVRDFLNSHEGSLVLELLRDAASINPAKRIPVCPDVQVLATAEYNRLLGHQEAFALLKRLGEPLKEQEKLPEFRPLGEATEDELPPPYIVPATVTK